MKRLIWLFQVVIFFLIAIPLAILPYKISLKVGEILGLLIYYLWSGRRKIALKNIEECILNKGLFYSGDFKGIIKESFKNMGKTFVEIIKIFFGFSNAILNSVEISGEEYFKKAKLKGKGVLFITGHCGNWELMAIICSLKIEQINVVARPIDNPYINRILERVRKKFGNKVIYKRGALRDIINALRRNESVGILMDQAVVSNEGYVIEFLGRGAWTTKMPALIARKTETPVLPVFINRVNGDRHIVKIYPEINLSNSQDKEVALVEDTKNFSRYIEDYIKEHPSEWLWIHRRWKRVNRYCPGINN